MKTRELFETPYLNNEELPYKILSKISKDALKRSYDEFGKIDNLTIFSGKISGFAAGFLVSDHLSTVVLISCRKVAYPIEPTGLIDYQQVSMVDVSKDFAEKGYAKKIYDQIAKKVDLVSDHEQYLGAKGLWKSLARESDVNVYVFDGQNKDYIRDADGKIKKYNGSNINDKTIWGTSVEHRTILLVATIKELN